MNTVLLVMVKVQHVFLSKAPNYIKHIKLILRNYLKSNIIQTLNKLGTQNEVGHCECRWECGFLQRSRPCDFFRVPHALCFVWVDPRGAPR